LLKDQRLPNLILKSKKNIVYESNEDGKSSDKIHSSFQQRSLSDDDDDMQIDHSNFVRKSENMAYRKQLKKFQKTEQAHDLKLKTGYRIALNHDDNEVLVKGDAEALSEPQRASCAGTKFEFESDQKFTRLARLLTSYVEVRMQQQFGMQPKYVPFKNDMTDSNFAQARIFVSADWKSNSKRALVLIQGTGDVRAGVWSRHAMINDSLNCGSMLPQIKFAVQNGMSCLVMNPNFERDAKGNEVDPRVNGMSKHARYVFKKYVVNRCKAEEIYIIAHSKGGKILMELLKRFTEEFTDTVTAVALTDSVHTDIRDDLIDDEEVTWLKENCVHFIRSSKKLNKKEKSTDHGMIPNTFSAGHPEHQYTTGYCWPEIQKFFNKKSGGVLEYVNDLSYVIS
jgi:hypothetical protein